MYHLHCKESRRSLTVILFLHHSFFEKKKKRKEKKTHLPSRKPSQTLVEFSLWVIGSRRNFLRPEQSLKNLFVHFVLP